MVFPWSLVCTAPSFPARRMVSPGVSVSSKFMSIDMYRGMKYVWKSTTRSCTEPLALAESGTVASPLVKYRRGVTRSAS